MRNLIFSLCCLTALLFGVPPARANHTALFETPIYGLTFYGDQLIRLDPATGAGRLVARLSAPVSGYGLAYRYGRLYTFNPTAGEVVEINPLTGMITRRMSVGITNVVGEGDIAFRSDGTAFISVAMDSNLNPINELYAVDVLSGSSRIVGRCHFPYDALAFDDHDVLFALAQGQGKLYIIDQNTGLGTVVGELGIPINSPFSGMGFAPDGTLYAAIDDRLFRISTTSGAATPVNTNLVYAGFSSISGVTFQAGAPDEELLGVTLYNHQLVRLNPRTGVGSLVGTNLGAVLPFGLAARGDKLYTFDGGSGSVLEIDPGSGRVVRTNNVQIPNVLGEGDIAFSPGGLGFVSTSLDGAGNPASALYAFDLATGASMKVGEPSAPLDGLAFDSEGMLFALAQGQGKLYSVNATNAALTLVGSGLGVEVNSPIAALTFTPDGRLLAAINDRIYSLNRSTGTANPVSTNVIYAGYSSISGLASIPVRRLGIVKEGGRVVVFSNGLDSKLQTSDQVAGPYIDVAAGENLLLVTGGRTNAFFRLQSR